MRTKSSSQSSNLIGSYEETYELTMETNIWTTRPAANKPKRKTPLQHRQFLLSSSYCKTMSGGLDYGSAAASGEKWLFSDEATPSGSGRHDSLMPPSANEGPLDSPTTEAANLSGSYAVPAIVIVVSIAALLLLAGGLKACAHFKERSKRRQSYKYSYTRAPRMRTESTTPTSSLHSTGYNSCPNCNSQIQLTDISSKQQPRLQEAVRIADALDQEMNKEKLLELTRKDSEETLSVDSSTCGDNAPVRSKVVEVEVHSYV